MFFTEDTKITEIAVHRVGSQTDPEGGIMISDGVLHLDEFTENAMIHFLFSSFKYDEYYRFVAQDGNVSDNGVYRCVSSILTGSDSLYMHSVALAKMLYAKCISENILKGEFYVVKFQNCVYQDQLVNAVGLFKAEKKETFLKVYAEGNALQVQAEEGSLVSKIEKGCLVLDVQSTDGYVVAAFDSGKGENGNYWMDNFLGLCQMEDNFFQTQKAIEMCNDFVRTALPENFNITKDQQAILLNRSAEFFKTNDEFSFDDYAKEVIQNNEAEEQFKFYRSQCENYGGYQLNDNFDISETAVKKQAKILKSVIKLDKNFHVYVHGKRDFISRGYDQDRKMQYYQLYFNEED